ncbi:MAG: hypothetical protein PGN25_16170 [Methylorubrum populi]
MITRILFTAAMATAFAASAAAQAPTQTGTGGGPGSTIYVPNTSSVGRTMPPAGGGGERRDSTVSERESRMEKKDDKIDTGICIGCDK